MAGTVTDNKLSHDPIGLEEITFTWLSDASGDADGTTPEQFTGDVENCSFIPDDTDVPTALWDVTIADKNGVDVLGGQGANRSATLDEGVALVGKVFKSALTLTVSNAGNAKRGKCILYIRKKN